MAVKQADGRLSSFLGKSVSSHDNRGGPGTQHLLLNDPFEAALLIFIKKTFSFLNSTHLPEKHHMIETNRQTKTLLNPVGEKKISQVRIIPIAQ